MHIYFIQGMNFTITFTVIRCANFNNKLFKVYKCYTACYLLFFSHSDFIFSNIHKVMNPLEYIYYGKEGGRKENATLREAKINYRLVLYANSSIHKHSPLVVYANSRISLLYFPTKVGGEICMHRGFMEFLSFSFEILQVFLISHHLSQQFSFSFRNK